MSALTTLRDYSEEAIAAVVTPIVTALEANRRAADEEAAGAARDALAKLPEHSKEIRAAQAAVHKARADEARCEAELAGAKGARTMAEIALWQAQAPLNDELKRLRLAAHAPHVKADARQLVGEAVDRVMATPEMGLDRPLRALFKLRQQVTNICEGDASSPAPDLLVWVRERLALIASDTELARAEFAAAQTQAARHDALAKITMA
jgi:hypothetical protein